MSNLQRYENEGIEVYIDNTTGESFFGSKGYASLVGLHTTTISRRLKGVTKELVQHAQVLTPGGVQGVTLIPESLIADWVAKDNPTVASKMLKAGIRLFLYGLAGYSVQVKPPIDQAPIVKHTLAAEVSESVASIHYNLSLIDPRLAQCLIDYAMQSIDTPLLTGDSERLAGVVEIAASLGYPVGKESSALGKAVATQYRAVFGSDPVEVSREVGGAFRKVKCYPMSEPIVIATIHEFYGACELG